jgi:hypothetical protein
MIRTCTRKITKTEFVLIRREIFSSLVAGSVRPAWTHHRSNIRQTLLSSRHQRVWQRNPTRSWDYKRTLSTSQDIVTWRSPRIVACSRRQSRSCQGRIRRRTDTEQKRMDHHTTWRAEECRLLIFKGIRTPGAVLANAKVEHFVKAIVDYRAKVFHSCENEWRRRAYRANVFHSCEKEWRRRA